MGLTGLQAYACPVLRHLPRESPLAASHTLIKRMLEVLNTTYLVAELIIGGPVGGFPEKPYAGKFELKSGCRTDQSSTSSD
jgi:hypothetical protein